MLLESQFRNTKLREVGLSFSERDPIGSACVIGFFVLKRVILPKADLADLKAARNGLEATTEAGPHVSLSTPLAPAFAG
jgi:hypothetical protein